MTLALALENEKRPAEATPHVREAVKDDPQNIDARQALVHILVDDLHEDAAMKEIREAVARRKISPSCISPWPGSDRRYWPGGGREST